MPHYGLLHDHKLEDVDDLRGADVYGATSEELWDELDGCGLRVFDLQGAGPFDRAAFAAQFGRPVWNWLAVPS